MAGDITYGTRTALANISRIHSTTNGQAKTFGEINGAGEVTTDIYMILPISSSATGGTYDVYLVESQDGTEWTDSIDPTGDTGDVSAQIADAKWLASIDTTYNASNRANAEIHLSIDMLSHSEYIGLVVVNNSGQTVPASGADGDSVGYTVS